MNNKFKVKEIWYEDSIRDYGGDYGDRTIVNKVCYCIETPDGKEIGRFNHKWEAQREIDTWFNEKALKKATEVIKKIEKLNKVSKRLEAKLRENTTKYHKLTTIPSNVRDYLDLLKKKKKARK